MTSPTVASAIRAALLTADPSAKVMAARRAARDWRLGRLEFTFDVAMPERPARPSRPVLMLPRDMPKRGKGGSPRGRIALLHALAHVEFVAIDLALDMAGRFGAGQEATFVADWLAVAADEALHFALLERRLRALGSGYGALPAHDGLWEAADATRDDVLARLAIVPMVLEARGLDVTPLRSSRCGSLATRPARACSNGFIVTKSAMCAVAQHGSRKCAKAAEYPPRPPGERWSRPGSEAL